MKRFWACLLALMMLFTGCALADDDYDDDYEDGNPPNSPEIYLPLTEDSSYVWTYTVDYSDILYITDNGTADLNRDGEQTYTPLYCYRLDGVGEGTAQVVFSYGIPNSDPIMQISASVVVDNDWNVMIFGMIVQ